MKIIKITDKEYPKRLLEITNPPKQLYVEGNENLLNNKSIAIVGSRNCTDYGIKYAEQFAKALAEKSITIISGLAIGIDSIAHENSKDCRGKTIAVLGSGFNHIYPEQNKELYKEILESGGCAISEYNPEEKVNMKNFPKRNRIVSGISEGVLVIEAGYRSGSTITGRLALEQNKKVFCLPRDIGISKGIGTNNLIQKGAKLVMTPNDILKELKLGKLKDEKYVEEEKAKEKETEIKVGEEYEKIYNLLSFTPKDLQYLSIKSGLNISKINQKLTMLELQGYIKSLPGNQYIKMPLKEK